MPDALMLRFEFEKGTDLGKAENTIREQLGKLDEISRVDTAPEKPRLTGLEVVGAIAVAVQVVRGVRKGVTELRKLLQELKALKGEVRGLQEVKVEVGPRKVPIDEVSEDDLQALASYDGSDETA